MVTRSINVTFALALAVAVAACEKKPEADEKKPAPAAKTSDQPTAKPAAGEPAAAPGASFAGAGGSYQVDPAHTQVVFKIEHLGASHQYGLFTRVEGSFRIDASDPSKSELDLQIPTASLFTAVKKRDDHLRSPDFFDAKQFPIITFKSKSVKATGANSYEVVGALTMHGVTNDVTVELEHIGAGTDPAAMGGAFRTGFNGQTTIERSDWKMDYMQGAGLGDEVTLLLAVEGTRKDG